MLYYVCNYFLRWKLCFAPCTPCLFQIMQTTGPNYASSIRVTLYIKQVPEHFFILLRSGVLMYCCELN